MRHGIISVYLDSVSPGIIFVVSKPTTVDYRPFNSILSHHKTIMSFKIVFQLAYLPVRNSHCSYPSETKVLN